MIAVLPEPNLLLLMVKLVEPKTKLNEIDTLAERKGHTVVRLPLYHCQYKPIELIWGNIKLPWAKRKTFKIADVQSLMEEELSNITIED